MSYISGSLFYFQYTDEREEHKSIYFARVNLKELKSIKPTQHTYFETHVDWIDIHGGLEERVKC